MFSISSLIYMVMASHQLPDSGYGRSKAGQRQVKGQYRHDLDLWKGMIFVPVQLLELLTMLPSIQCIYPPKLSFRVVICPSLVRPVMDILILSGVSLVCAVTRSLSFNCWLWNVYDAKDTFSTTSEVSVCFLLPFNIWLTDRISNINEIGAI